MDIYWTVFVGVFGILAAIIALYFLLMPALIKAEEMDIEPKKPLLVRDLGEVPVWKLSLWISFLIATLRR